MNSNVVAAGLLGVSLVVASAIYAGRFAMSERSANPSTSSVFILDRFTGEVRVCRLTECEVLRTEKTQN
jgi:hypothetical protein